MIELPASHPLSTTRGQLSYLWQIGWRWISAGVLASAFKLPFLGTAVALLLFHLWFRGLRQTEFWTPCADEMTGRSIWSGRVALLLVVGLGVAGSLSDPRMILYVAAWAGFAGALLIESFVVPPILAAKKVTS
jgi:hypothetical protein